MNLTSLTIRLLKINIKCSITSTRYLSQHIIKLKKPDLRFKNARKLPQAAMLESNSQDDDSPAFFDYALLSIPIISFILGSWQIERRRWKLNLIEDLKKRIECSPVPLPEDLDQLQEMEYKPVKVKGEFLYDKEFVLGPRSLILDGKGASEKGGSSLIGSPSSKYSGYLVITPFKVQDRDLTILVNRGWVKNKIEKMPLEKLGHVPGVVEITGLVRLNEARPPFMAKHKQFINIYHYRDVNGMARHVDADPVYIDLVQESSAPIGPIASQTRVDLRNEHLTYIFTWYSLSGLSGWMWYRQFIRRLSPW